jgi:hypothetical protein
VDAPRGALWADVGGGGDAIGAGVDRAHRARAELGLAPGGALAVTLRAGAPAQETSENRAIRGGHWSNTENNLRARTAEEEEDIGPVFGKMAKTLQGG